MASGAATFELPIIGDLLERFAAAPRVRGLDWSIRHIKNENGRPYDHKAYPHLGAPGGPWDAWDDRTVRIIVLQFATRLGKTFFGQCACLFTADTQPCPMMGVGPVEKVTRDITARTYRMIEMCPPLAGQLVREDLRSRDRIELDHCTLHVGWSRSPSTLADKNIKVGHGFEIDKYERLSTSKEADPLDLFLERKKDYPSYKYILDSTPSVAGLSRIERWRLLSSNCSLQVPCPHCHQYQPLRFAQLTWQRNEQGGQDPDVARQTAFYECEHCREKILDQHRMPMIQLGVWVPAGSRVDDARALELARARQLAIRAGSFSRLGRPPRYLDQGYLVGQPERDGVVAGYQLSSLYALALSWGEIAAQWILSYQDPINLRNFINGWLGETWAPKKRQADWEVLGRKIIVDVPRYVAPVWSSLVTVGIDRQLDHYKYVVEAFGPRPQSEHPLSHTLDYGHTPTLDWIVHNVIRRRYEHAAGGEIGVAGTLIDSGHATKEVYLAVIGLLNATPATWIFPCKGASQPLFAPFAEGETGKDTIMPGMPLFRVDPDWTNAELQERLAESEPGAVHSIGLFAGEPAEHEDFLRQLLNAELAPAPHQKERLVWAKIIDYPDDYRDAKRYARCAQLILHAGGPPPPRMPPDAAVPAGRAARRHSKFMTPDGRPFVASQR